MNPNPDFCKMRDLIDSIVVKLPDSQFVSKEQTSAIIAGLGLVRNALPPINYQKTEYAETDREVYECFWFLSFVNYNLLTQWNLIQLGYFDLCHTVIKPVFRICNFYNEVYLVGYMKSCEQELAKEEATYRAELEKTYAEDCAKALISDIVQRWRTIGDFRDQEMAITLSFQRRLAELKTNLKLEYKKRVEVYVKENADNSLIVFPQTKHVVDS